MGFKFYFLGIFDGTIIILFRIIFNNIIDAKVVIILRSIKNPGNFSRDMDQFFR